MSEGDRMALLVRVYAHPRFVGGRALKITTRRWVRAYGRLRPDSRDLKWLGGHCWQPSRLGLHRCRYRNG